jgi:hypothetical protein
MTSTNDKIGRFSDIKNTKYYVFLVGLAIIVTANIIYPMQVLGDGNYTIPSWIKENSKWWSEGKISEQDYISGLQYLVDKGFIKIPVTMVSNNATTGNRTAQSFVVHIMAGQEYVFNTFSKFNNLNQPINGVGQNQLTGYPAYYQPQFQLEGLVSVDKKDFYNLISNYLSKSAAVEPYDMDIDVVAGDGSIIETLHYTKCKPNSYNVYTNDDSSAYRLGNGTGLEIRDQTTFLCSGFLMRVP